MTEIKEEVVAKPRRRKVPTITEEILVEETFEDVVEDIKVPTQEVVKPKVKTKGIIAVDNGGDNTKVFTQDMQSPTFFKSKKGFGSEDDFLDPVYDDNGIEEKRSYIVRWENQVYLTNRRMIQGRFKDTGNTTSKATDYFILSTLIAIAKFGYDINYVVTSVPYEYRRTSEVEAIKERLIGEHLINVDGIDYTFTINGVLVTPEAQAGHAYLEIEGMATLLEIGSRTVGFATNYIELDDEGYVITDQPIREKSGTIDRAGVEISNLKESEYIPFCSNIYAHMSSVISEQDKIVAFGGGVLIDGIKKGLERKFKNIAFAKDPLYVQVKGMLIAGEQYPPFKESLEAVVTNG